MKKILFYISNKYILTLTAFLFWMLFFDSRNIFNTIELKSKLHELQEKKAFYVAEIKKAQSDLSGFHNDPNSLVKYAREHYKMKKESEDIFLIDTSKN